MTTITLVKTLPTSQYYTGSGVTTITLNNFDSMVINSKKSLIKIAIPKTNNTQTAPATNNDQPDNQVIDLKRLEQSIKFSGYLEDDATQTAWNKFWKLVAMGANGGPITSLTIGTAAQLKFPSGVAPPYKFTNSTPQAWVENIMGQISSDDTGDITANFPAKPARIKVDLDIYLGYARSG